MCTAYGHIAEASSEGRTAQCVASRQVGNSPRWGAHYRYHSHS
jgi:hypothetical protein